MATFDIPTNPTPAVLRAICDRLRNRAQLEGVNVSRHNWDVANGNEHLVFLNGSDAPTYVTTGLMRVRHSLTLKGFIFVVRDGNTEEAADEAMDRAYEIEREMQREFRGSDAGHVLLGVDNRRKAIDVLVSRLDWDSGPWANGSQHGFRIDFEITVSSDTHRIPG